jgi:DNA-binding MarR family transcriptional regulator
MGRILPDRAYHRGVAKPKRVRSLLIDTYAAGLLTEQLMNRELERIGVSPQGFAVLSAIVVSDPMTPTELAEIAGYPYTTLLDTLNGLADRGLVSRSPHPTDGRSYLVVPTRRGTALVQRAKPAVTRSMEAIRRALPPGTTYGEVEAVVHALREALTVAVEEPAATSRPA